MRAQCSHTCPYAALCRCQWATFVSRSFSSRPNDPGPSWGTRAVSRGLDRLLSCCMSAAHQWSRVFKLRTAFLFALRVSIFRLTTARHYTMRAIAAFQALHSTVSIHAESLHLCSCLSHRQFWNDVWSARLHVPPCLAGPTAHNHP